MEGVILFADDFVFSHNDFESRLFHRIKENGIPVLPIGNLTDFANTIKSISTFKAIILDWEFIEMLDEQKFTKNPLDILKENKFYSLIFIYSHTQIGAETQESLKQIFGNKIEFLTKIKEEDQIEAECNKIFEAIKNFEASNSHLQTPFLWSHAINKSAQDIFNELELSDPNWIKEIYSNAVKDGAEPNSEVINVFQNLLNESIIQNDNLIKSLANAATLADVPVADKEESLAKLYNRIYYTQLLSTAPIMTGDIFKFSEDEFAVLITPECDINSKKATLLEFLKFSKTAASSFMDRKKKEKLKKESKGESYDDSFFNNGVPSRHLLLSFPFESKVYNQTAFIDFETAFVVKSKAEFDGKRSDYKLNSPYIYQLRQRYLAYIGRVGVPAIPPSLKSFNLK
ncbi:MAG: hypothetical protein IPN76_11920 [Saprospiraceae bacterium]|nr:hypothetical protein [Saprospiraceae bacterium]